MIPTSDLHVVETRPLVAPALLHRELPLGNTAATTVREARERIKAILRGEDRRLLVIVGPCSVHDVGAAREYAAAIAAEHERHRDQLEVVLKDFEARHWQTRRVFMTRYDQIEDLLGLDGREIGVRGAAWLWRD